MSGEVEKCPILHVRPKFDVFTLMPSLVSRVFLEEIAVEFSPTMDIF